MSALQRVDAVIQSKAFREAALLRPKLPASGQIGLGVSVGNSVSASQKAKPQKERSERGGRSHGRTKK